MIYDLRSYLGQLLAPRSFGEAGEIRAIRNFTIVLLLGIPIFLGILSNFGDGKNSKSLPFPNAKLVLTKPAIHNGEYPVLTLSLNQKKVASVINLAFADDVKIKAEVIKRKEKQDVTPIITSKGSGVYEITFSKGMKVGKQTLKVTASQNNQTQSFEQDFTWGVLALNPDKMTYLSSDTANISMAVLDDSGRMDCKAKLSLLITKPNGSVEELSSENGKIQVTPQCKLYTYSKDPDFKTSFTTSREGTYSLDLIAKTSEGTHEIKDVIKVQQNVAFDIERIAPTRIYPPLNYPVQIKIKANKDFSGEVLEEIPLGFKISKSKEINTVPYYSINPKQTSQEISWNVNIKKGDEITLGYSFDAPYKSPNFYFFKPLRLEDKQKNLEFAENRSWEIAVDATYTISGTVYSDEGTTAMGSPPCNGSTQALDYFNNGGAASTTTCASGTAAYSLTVSALSGDTVTITLNANSTPKGTTKIRVSTATTITGVDIYQNRLIARAEGASIATADICQGNFANTVIANCNSAILTLNSNIEFHVWTGDTFDEGGDQIVTQGTGDFHLATNATASNFSSSTVAGNIVMDTGSSLSGGSNTVNGGSITTSGTATINMSSGTITISGTGNIGGGTGAITFSGLTITGTGNVTAASDFTVNGVLTIQTSGTFNGGSGETVTLASTAVGSGTPLSISGTFTPNTGTINFTGTGSITVTSTTYYNLGIGTTGNTTSNSFTLGGNITVNNVLTVGSTTNTGVHTLNASNKIVTLAGSATPFVVNSQGSLNESTSTFNYTGTSATNITGETYYALGAGTSADSGSVTFTLAGDTTVSNVLTVGASSGTGLHTLSGSSRILTLSATGTPFVVNSQGAFSQSTSTVKYTGTSAAVTITALTYYNLELGTTADSSSNTFTPGGNITVSNLLTVGAASGTGLHTLDGSSFTLTLSGSGTPFLINSQGAFTTSTSTVNYTGTSATTITSLTYYNLGAGTTSDSNTPTYTLAADLTVSNIMTVGASSGSTHTLDLTTKILTLSGTGGAPLTVNSQGSLTGGGVVYSGNNAVGNTTISTGVNISYKNLTINNSSETYTTPATTTLTVTGTLTATAGTFDLNTNNSPASVGNVVITSTLLAPPSSLFNITGDFTNNGTFTNENGTTTFNGNGVQTIAGSGTPAITFYNLTLSNAKTVKFTAGETFVTNGLFTVSNYTNIASTTTSQWFINHQGTETVTAGSIINSGCDASSTQITVTIGYNDGNNGTCWFFAGPSPASMPTIKGNTTIKGTTVIK